MMSDNLSSYPTPFLCNCWESLNHVHTFYRVNQPHKKGYLIFKERLTVATRHVSYKFYHYQVVYFRQTLDLFQVYQAT